MTDFQKELTNFGNTEFNLFTITRSGEKELNVDAFNEMIEYSIKFSQKYGLAEEIEASGYYSTVDDSLVGMDMYETMRYFEANSTPEFNELISRIIVDEKTIDNEEIIKNNKLLPNEQIALIMVNGMIKNDFAMQTRGGVASDCRKAYEAKMKDCKYWLVAGSTLTLVSGAFSLGLLSSLFAVATTIDYSNCTDAATSSYMDCMELVNPR